MPTGDTPKKPRTAAEVRAERLAAELRANLKRRKEKGRAAKEDTETPSPDTESPEKPSK